MSEKETTKDKLVQTASRLFQVQGYHATGLNQILKESGFPKGSLYYHFPAGKEQLALEAVERTTLFVSQNIQTGLARSADPAAAIQDFVKEMAYQVEKEGYKGGVPIASLALETTLISEPLRQACREAYEQFQTAFAQKLRAGGFEESRARELSVVLNSLIEGAFLLAFTGGNNRPLLLAAEQIPIILSGNQ